MKGMKPRLADVMNGYHRVRHPIGDGTTQLYLRARFDSVKSGLGSLIMEYDRRVHPLNDENIPSLVERLNALIPGLGPLIIKYDQISHREHPQYANEIPFSQLAERFNEITGMAYSQRQKNVLQATTDRFLCDRLQYFMDCALDLYDNHLKRIPNERLHFVMSEVEDLIYSGVYDQPHTKLPGNTALNIYRDIRDQKHPVEDIHLLFSELVDVIKDKREINIPTSAILREH